MDARGGEPYLRWLLFSKNDLTSALLFHFISRPIQSLMNLYIKDLEHDEPISNMIRAMLTESVELN